MNATAHSATLYTTLAGWAASRPSAPAILSPGRGALSFADLVRQIGAASRYLGSHGLEPGSRIAVVAPRGPDTGAAILAIACSRVCIPLNPSATDAECTAALVATRSRALLTLSDHDAAAIAAARRLGLTVLGGEVPAWKTASRFDLDTGTPVLEPSALSVAPDDIAIVAVTSGSTRQKIVPITHRQYLARGRKTQAFLGLTPEDRCVNLMPLCYQHGINSGLLGPLLCGGSAIQLPTFDQPAFLAAVGSLAATWYTAGATHHQAILGWLRRDPDIIAGHRLRFARSGAAPLARPAQAELEQLLGVPVVESYSSTETGTVAANPPAGRRKPGTVGVSDSAEVAIVDDSGASVPLDTAGEVVVRGAGVICAYENDSDANRQAFRDGWYRTGDLGRLDADNYLTLCGRIDEVINRGGEKIAPHEVDEALLSHPAVAQAVTFAMPHPTLHEEIAAAVVPREGRFVSEAELKSFLSRRLAPFKVPRRFVITSELPRGPTEKLRRRDLSAHFGLTIQPAGTSDTATEKPLERTLLLLWGEVLGRSDVGLDDDFFRLGGDSLTAVALLERIAQQLHVELPLSDLVDRATVREMAQSMIGQPLGTTPDVSGIHTDGTERPVFALGARKGFVLRLMLVARELGAEQPFYGLQPPGMDWESAGCHTIQAMAAHYIDRVREIQPRGPYRLLGASFGGLVVYEMALQLQAAGESVEFLGLIDTRPTSCRRGATIDRDEPRVLRYPNQPPSASKAAGLRVGAAHIRARNAYLMEEPFRGELTYFFCAGECITPRRDRRRWWRHFAKSVRFVRIPGRHGAIHEEPQFSSLCGSLRTCLAGQAPPALSGAQVFGYRYRLTSNAGDVKIHGPHGAVFPVVDRALGRLQMARQDEREITLTGWAAAPQSNAPATSLLVFLAGRLVGYGSTGGHPRSRATHKPDVPNSGFRLRFPLPRGVEFRAADLEIFVLLPESQAARLHVPQQTVKSKNKNKTDAREQR